MRNILLVLLLATGALHCGVFRGAQNILRVLMQAFAMPTVVITTNYLLKIRVNLHEI
jgi:hypothetical protein